MNFIRSFMLIISPVSLPTGIFSADNPTYFQ
jgi:hypothetical protein